jgi:CubicO group peptidase (beta-lactamase class C family)
MTLPSNSSHPSTEQAGSMASIDEHLKSYTDDHRIAGLLAALWRDDRCTYLGCHGVLDLTRETSIQADTLFRLYSMTKPITAAAVMALWDEGHFAFTDPIHRFLPEFEKLRVFSGGDEDALSTESLKRPITIHDLLTHTSGLAYGLEPVTPIDRIYQQQGMLRGNETLAEKMEKLVNIPLLHQPGERVTYSFSYDVLSRMVEVIATQPFDMFLKDRFFDPLHMTDTGFQVANENLDRLAAIYRIKEGQPPTDLRPLAWLGLPDLPDYLCGEWIDRSRPMRFFSGGGGLVSKMEDYAHFAQMLLHKGEWQGHRILSRTAVEIMSTNQLPPEFCGPGIGGGYGLGVLTDPEKAGLPASKGAFGGSGAAGTEFWVDPSKHLIGLFMVQMIPGWAYPAAQAFKFMAAQAVQ